MRYGLFLEKIRKVSRRSFFMFVLCCFAFLGVMQNPIFVQSETLSAPPVEANVSYGILDFSVKTVIALLIGIVASVIGTCIYNKYVTIPALERKMLKRTLFYLPFVPYMPQIWIRAIMTE